MSEIPPEHPSNGGSATPPVAPVTTDASIPTTVAAPGAPAAFRTATSTSNPVPATDTAPTAPTSHSNEMPAASTAPAAEALTAPVGASEAPPVSFPPLPPISTEDFEKPTDYANSYQSALDPSNNDASFDVSSNSFTAVNAPTGQPSPAPVPDPLPAPISTVPPSMPTTSQAEGQAEKFTTTSASAAGPASVPTPPPTGPTTASAQTPSSIPPTAPIPATSSTAAPPPPPPMSIATSVSSQSGPGTPGAHPPPSMPQYQSTSTVPTTSNVPGMQGHPPMGSPHPTPAPHMQSMGSYGQAYSSQMGQMGMQSQMNYQSPGGNSSRSRAHQREVKRRTKTGCLTCRKRRIKCDEGHPVCRNCVKSKRECLGYDPGFRPQPGPSDIRPAHSPQPSLIVNPQENYTNNTYPSAPPGYIPASAQPFPPSIQSDSSIQSFDQSNGNRQGPAEPSVEGSDTMSIMASVQDTIDTSMSQPVSTPDLSNPGLMPLSGQVGRQEKVNIQDLLALQGIAPPPPYPIVPIQQARLDQIQTVYLHTYAPAIDRFLETRWFRDKGLSQLLTNAQLMAQYSALIDAFNDPKIEDAAVRGRVESFEASVVWDTMSICRSARNLVSNGSTEPTQEYDLLTTANRFDVLEALITDDHLKDNPLRADLTRPPPSNLNPLEGQLRTRSLNFWNCIGHFLTLHDNEASSAVEIDETLARCRSLLDEIENRDVLYSMAIGRHLGQRLSDFHPRNRPENSSDEKNANTKLLVAQRFIEDESKAKGTTQVVKRLCGMVHRLWELKNILLPRV